MLGCKGSASVFSPESSICPSCPHFEGCHETALHTTRAKRRSAEAVFLSAKFAHSGVDQDDAIEIALSAVSDRVKRHAEVLGRKGFRFRTARKLLSEGRNPFRSVTTNTAFVLVFDLLLQQRTARKSDIIEALMTATGCSKATACGHVSDALGLGQLIRAVNVSRFTATLHIEESP